MLRSGAVRGRERRGPEVRKGRGRGRARRGTGPRPPQAVGQEVEVCEKLVADVALRADHDLRGGDAAALARGPANGGGGHEARGHAAREDEGRSAGQEAFVQSAHLGRGPGPGEDRRGEGREWRARCGRPSRRLLLEGAEEAREGGALPLEGRHGVRRGGRASAALCGEALLEPKRPAPGPRPSWSVQEAVGRPARRRGATRGGARLATPRQQGRGRERQPPVRGAENARRPSSLAVTSRAARGHRAHHFDGSSGDRARSTKQPLRRRGVSRADRASSR